MPPCSTMRAILAAKASRSTDVPAAGAAAGAARVACAGSAVAFVAAARAVSASAATGFAGGAAGGCLVFVGAVGSEAAVVPVGAWSGVGAARSPSVGPALPARTCVPRDFSLSSSSPRGYPTSGEATPLLLRCGAGGIVRVVGPRGTWETPQAGDPPWDDRNFSFPVAIPSSIRQPEAAWALKMAHLRHPGRAGARRFRSLPGARLAIVDGARLLDGRRRR